MDELTLTRQENQKLVKRINELENEISTTKHHLDAVIKELSQKKSVIRSLQNELSLYNEQYLR